jgi:hypothetical protein
VQPSHLSIGTKRDNSNDKVAADRQSKGEDQSNAVLTDTIAGYIKWMRNVEGLSTSEIAGHFGISQSMVSNIAAVIDLPVVAAIPIIDPPSNALPPCSSGQRRRTEWVK